MDPRETGNLEPFYGAFARNPFILDTIYMIDDSTPLHVAAYWGQTYYAKEIIKQCPGFAKKLDRFGWYPIHLAAVHGHVEIVKELLGATEAGGIRQCFLKNEEGKTPLDYALMGGRKGLVHEILSACSDHHEYGPNMISLIESARKFSLESLLDLVRLVEMRFHIKHHRDSGTVTLLKRENKLAKEDAIGLSDADPTDQLAALNELLTPRPPVNENVDDHVAATKELLIEEPSMLFKICSGVILETQLHITFFSGQTQGLTNEITRKNRAEFVTKLNEGCWFSPIHVASQYGYFEIAKLLSLQVGSSLCFIIDKQGRTPLHLALKYDHPQVFNILMMMPIGDELLDAGDWDGDTTGTDLAAVYIKILVRLAGQRDCNCILSRIWKEVILQSSKAEMKILFFM